MRLSAIGLAVCLLSAPLGAQAAPPLDLDDVVELLRLAGSAQAKVDIISRRCVTFPFDDAAASRLRAAAADEAVVGAVRAACFQGAELVVESAPPNATVTVDNQSVGTTPWTGRYSAARNVRVAATSQGRGLVYQVNLQPGIRSRAYFGFVEDTVAAPRVRTSTEIIRALGLESRWVPTRTEPRAPSDPGQFSSVLLIFAMLGAGVYQGMEFCSTNDCAIPPELDETGEDAKADARKGAGAGAGLVAGIVSYQVLTKLVNGVRGSRYRSNRASYERSHAEWVRSMGVAKEQWLRSHPDVRQQVEADVQARDQARARNAAIAERNRAMRPSSLTTEPLPGPSQP